MVIDRFERFSLALFNILRYWNKIAGDVMKEFGLKGACAFYLVSIYRYEGDITAARLCKLCGKDKADVSRALTAMEEKGLVTRESINPYRARLLLTEDGRETAARISDRAGLAVDIAGRGVSDDERRVFYEVLDVISENLRLLSVSGLPTEESQNNEAETGDKNDSSIC